MNDGITAVIMNWKRPDNVARIVSTWHDSDLIAEAIVWNNNASEPFRHKWARVVNAAEDFGLYTRFAATCLASNTAVLIQDDDLELPAESIRRLHDAWRREPDILHGVFGRMPKPDGSYAKNVLGDAPAPIVLTRVLMTHHSHAATFFRVAPRFDEIQQESRPHGNGEDIIFSYAAMRRSGQLNRVHRLPVTELPAPHAIHGNWKRHVAHRTRLLRACQAWLKED